MWFKYTVKNVDSSEERQERRPSCPSRSSATTGAACTAINPSGRMGKPLFAGDGYAGLSATSASGTSAGSSSTPRRSRPSPTRPPTAIVASSPATRRPVNLAYSSRNRSASIRIPVQAGNSPKSRRIEVRFPDATCNPYLGFAAMMMAGLDGVQNRIDPGDPLDKDIYALSPEELKEVPHMPGSLDEALVALEQDHEFLLRGDVFTQATSSTPGSSTSASARSTPCASARCLTSSSSTTTPEPSLLGVPSRASPEASLRRAFPMENAGKKSRRGRARPGCAAPREARPHRSSSDGLPFLASSALSSSPLR